MLLDCRALGSSPQSEALVNNIFNLRVCQKQTARATEISWCCLKGVLEGVESKAISVRYSPDVRQGVPGWA